MRFHVTLNDRLPMNSMGIGSIAVGYSNPTTVHQVEADEVKVTDQGDLLFYGHIIESIDDRNGYQTINRQPIECFARGQWTRWKRIE